jgi:hypothetical protein
MAEPSSLSGAAGLRSEEHPWGDFYFGPAEALIAAGLITPDQLPGLPGHNKYTVTFFDGRPVKKGANHPRDERYLRVARHGKTFEVHRGISRQVEDERCAAKRAQCERDAAAKREQEKREIASKKTAEDFREACARSIGFVRGYVDEGCDGLYPFKFPPDARAEIEEVLRKLELLFWHGQVLPLHPGKARAGHLRLAWSAS